MIENVAGADQAPLLSWDSVGQARFAIPDLHRREGQSASDD